jgi:long-subunit acyl-CoA synthetase (AMP-forming)
MKPRRVRHSWSAGFTGDLGRVDDDGNLYLVGRSKEIIVDTNGKNVYPDELEELYEDSVYIKELSIVGLLKALVRRSPVLLSLTTSTTFHFRVLKCIV